MDSTVVSTGTERKNLGRRESTLEVQLRKNDDVVFHRFRCT